MCYFMQARLAGPADVAIVRALVSLVNPYRDSTRWDRRWSIVRWVAIARLRRMFTLDDAVFDDALSRAEDAGWIASGETSRGNPAVTLCRPALAMLGLFSGRKYREVDADRLEELGPHAAIVGIVAGYVSATPLVELIAERLGRDAEDLWGEIRAAEADGWLHPWADHPAGPSVTLSATSASRLRLCLSDDGSMWLRVGQPDPTRALDPVAVLGASVSHDADLSDPEMRSTLIDSMPDLSASHPLGRAVASEDAELALCRAIAEDLAARRDEPEPYAEPDGSRAIDNPSRPDHARRLDRRRISLVGMQRPWPVPGWMEHPHGSDPKDRPWLVPWTPEAGPCPACTGIDLGILGYCPTCDRAGWDRIAAELAEVIAPCPARIVGTSIDPADVNEYGHSPADIAAMSPALRRSWGYPDVAKANRRHAAKIRAAQRDRKTIPKAMRSAARRTARQDTATLKGGLGR